MSEGQLLAVVLTQAAGFLTSQLHPPSLRGAKVAACPWLCRKAPQHSSASTSGLFLPRRSRCLVRVGARGPRARTPRDSPLPYTGSGLPRPPRHISRSALRSASWAQQDRCVLLGRSPVLRPGSRQESPAKVPWWSSWVPRALLLPGILDLCCWLFMARKPASVLSPSAGCLGSGASSATSDPARTGGPGELPPAVGALHLSFFCVQSSVCWVPIFFILVDFSSFLRKGGR